jgi:hypothetical protein
LPAIPVPLLNPDPDIGLDLQIALTTVYDELRYDLILDYTRPPDVPLEGDAAVWAEQILRSSRWLTATKPPDAPTSE